MPAENPGDQFVAFTVPVNVTGDKVPINYFLRIFFVGIDKYRKIIDEVDVVMSTPVPPVFGLDRFKILFPYLYGPGVDRYR